MARLDQLKEEISYLKFWQGVVVITDITLIGWLVSTFDTASSLRVALAAVGIAFFSVAIIVVHRQIDRRMDEIGNS